MQLVVLDNSKLVAKTLKKSCQDTATKTEVTDTITKIHPRMQTWARMPTRTRTTPDAKVDTDMVLDTSVGTDADAGVDVDVDAEKWSWTWTPTRDADTDAELHPTLKSD